MIKEQIAKQVRVLLAKKWYFIVYTHPVNPLLQKGTIVDCETTGLDPKIDHILTLGILKRNKAEIYQLVQCRCARFKRLCHYIVARTPTPRYAYASHFEADFLNIKDDWIDLTQYFEVEYDYANPFRRYRLVDCTSHPFPSEPYDIDGAQVPNAWQLWLKTKDPNFLTDIVYHSLCDLLRTQQLTDKDSIRAFL